MPALILIVDDEAALSALLEKYLARLGYQVEISPHAVDAWARFAAAPQSYAAVLADQTLPDQPGEDLLQRMLELNPALAAVLSSGYPCDPRCPGIRFLQKPYPPQALKELLEAMLARPRQASA